MKHSTFVRKTRKQFHPNGTKPSVHTGQLLVSSGLHDLDVILGGGLPLGSLICLHEDTHSQYNQTLLKYFLSEGLSCKHSLCVVCSNGSSKKFISSLPFNNSYQKLVSQSQLEQDLKQHDEEEAKKHLKIALRYEEYVSEQIQRKKEQLSSAYTKELSKVSSRTVGTVMCHEYDLSKDVQPELLQQNEDIYGIDMLDLKKDDLYSSLYDEIAKIIEKGKSAYAKQKSSSVVRIAIQSLGSLIVGKTEEEDGKLLIKFLHSLKVLLRSGLGICMVTIPKGIFDESIVRMIEHLSDIVLDMDSFAGQGIDVSEKYEIKEYTGLFYIKKLPKMNSLTFNYAPDTLNYTFKMKRRKMYIEIMHLPPEESREADRKDRPKFKQNPLSEENVSCSSGLQKSDLDF